MSKLTVKQEAFCQLYVDLGNASEAYRRAYDSKAKPESVHVNASKVLSDAKVSLRVTELQKELEEACMWTRMDSIKTLKEIATGDDAEAKPSDKVNAVKVINAMNGWDKRVIDHRSSDGSMTPKGIDKSLVDALTKKLID